MFLDELLGLLRSHSLFEHVEESSSTHTWLLQTSWNRSWSLPFLKPLDVLLNSLPLLEVVLLLIRKLWFIRSNCSLSASNSHLTLLNLLHLLLLNTLLDELIQLVLRLDDILGICWHQALYYEVGLLLVLEGQSEILE